MGWLCSFKFTEQASKLVLRVHCLMDAACGDGRARRLSRSADLQPDGSWVPIEESEDASFLLACLKPRLVAKDYEGEGRDS